MMLAIGKNLVVVIRKPRSKYYRMACFGGKRHYRKDGSCACVEAMLAHVKPKYRARVKIDPWGGKPPAVQP